ncbi:hypothetical protein HWB05_gp065 [Streptomyces phage BRock]|uniref:Uncharacterized protein n=1 Tax=Streptomyces phage BRock TaxID=1913591 RepID=A0A1J0GVW4_9CAUD|nr:hypothetical protein HWB05_gp065 [Streptomyces phage BRock]APC46327.1 hypothetical protein [Streptomyces phage BRock]
MAAIKVKDKYRRKSMPAYGVYEVVGVQPKTVSLKDPNGTVTVVLITVLEKNYNKEN